MKYLKYLISTRISLVLLLAFAGAMAVATFIENDHGSPAARALVYEAWWFEIILLWLALNFMFHIGQYKLFHQNRWPIGLFHLAFVIIIIGAGITRYFSNEGMIHIREGSTENTFYSTEHYLQLQKHEGDKVWKYEKPLTLISHQFKPLNTKAQFHESNFKVSFEEYIPGARQEIRSGEQSYLDMAVAIGEGREDYFIPQGNAVQMGSISLGTHKDSENPIKVFKSESDSSWLIHSAIHLQVMEMATGQIGVLHAGESAPLKLRTLYQWDGGAFMLKSIHENAALSYVAEKDEKMAENLPDVVKIKITDQQDQLLSQEYIKLVNFSPAWHSFSYAGKNYTFTYGPRAVHLPFSLSLSAFELERYPGSKSPASYASQVMVKDEDHAFPYRIFMNNVLDYKGYRFYQASYDQDEKGTVLSVNQDRPGTYISYLGYFLLSLGMFLSIFIKGSRFSLMNRKLGNIKSRQSGRRSRANSGSKNSGSSEKENPKSKSAVPAMLVALIFCCMNAQAQNPQAPSLVPTEKAAEYGKLIVQDLDGRMKPLNTLANEIIRKLNGKSYITIPAAPQSIRLSPEQFLLAVQLDPVTYSRLPIIKIHKEKSRQVFEALQIKPDDRISFQDFLSDDGHYLLQELVEEANLLKPSERNEAHKELLKTDERFNIFYALLTGDFLRIFPNKNDHNHTWFTSQQHQLGFDEEDALFVKNITALYLAGLSKGILEDDWHDADQSLAYIRLFQQKAGEKVYPTRNIIQAELLYNRLNLGKNLFAPFWMLGICMMMLGITMLFKEAKPVLFAWNSGKVLSWLGFAIFTAHLSLRWYIARHPPWTDGFEMLVFVAWGVLLFGLLFAGKSKFTVPLSLLFSGTLLFVGYLDWLNPEITNLMPVLHSYWLKIHVAIIVSGYAPLALAAILALLSLFLLIFKPGNPKPQWWISMQELSIVNELSISIGLFLLTIGTFLGGVWANESWGRYWAWDPKETWALISIIIYAIVLHLRLIPVFKNALLFNLASLWAFSSIIMTSFGVNYYLSGLHSYAAGDPVPIPQWVYWIISLLLLVSAVAAFKYRQLSQEDKRNLVP